VGEERARLFVALDLPDAVREALVAWRAPLLAGVVGERLRPVAPEALHVTLCFLGDLPLGSVSAVTDALVASEGTPRPGLALGDPLWLPRRAPRVLTVALADGRGELGRLQGLLAGRLAAGGWLRPGPRPFLPHVTVARVRGRAPREGGGRGRSSRDSEPDLASVPLAPPPALAFAGASVTLYRSHLGGAGARYEGLARAELR
jgi:2'-5' RNA ligase